MVLARPTRGEPAPSRPGGGRPGARPTALAAVLCFVQIAGRSLGFDEAATVTIAAQHGSALGSAIAHDGGNMSGYYLLLHVLIAAFGNGELLIRLPSALASIATVALVGMIGLRLFGRRAAFAAGLLAAVSLPLVFWAQNARGLRADGGVRRARRSWSSSRSRGPGASDIATRGASGSVGRLRGADDAGAPTRASSPCWSSRHSSWPCWRRRQSRRLRQFAGALAGIALLCVPLLVLAIRRGAGQLFWVPRPTRKLEVQVLQSLTSAGLEPSFHPTSTTTALMVLTGAVLLAMASAGVRARPGRDSLGWAMAAAWLAVPVVLALVYSLVSQPIFLPRNLLMSVPATWRCCWGRASATPA